MQLDLNTYNLNFTLVSHNCDIDSITHKRVEDYLKDKYGINKVCHIANYSKFGAKTVIKDLCRVFELDFNLSNQLTKMLDDNKIGIDMYQQLSNAHQLAKKLKLYDVVQFIDKNKQQLCKYGNRLVGMIRQSGKHASGILISNKQLNDSEIPVMKIGGQIVTAMQQGGDERQVAQLGYCKLDILGLNAATITSKTINKIQNVYGIYSIEDDIIKSSMNDDKIYQQFRLGNTRDIFQFGSDSMITFLKRVQPTNIEDLCAVNAGWRPAIINSGATDQYIQNRNNFKTAQQKYKKISVKLEQILRDSYYIPLYQQSIMFILQQIGGFSLAQADKGRKILKLLHKGNQQKTKDFFTMLDKFKQGALNNGMSQKNVQWLLDIMGKYSEYSFNRSHSFCYSVNGYLAMYLKVYFPLQYYSTLLQYSTKQDIGLFIKQIKSNNINIGNYRLNHTRKQFTEDYDKNMILLQTGLAKGTASKDTDIIADYQSTKDIKNIYQLIKFINEKKISKRTFQPLCRLKFFSQIFGNSKQLQFVMNDCRKLSTKKDFNQQIDAIIDKHSSIEDYSVQQFNRWQQKYFEFYLSQHPFYSNYELMLQQFPQLVENCYSPKQFSDQMKQRNYFLYGIINKIEAKKSKKTGKQYYRMNIEDDTSNINVTIFDSNVIANLAQGNFIIIEISKSKFGLTKAKDGLITIVKGE